VDVRLESMSKGFVGGKGRREVLQQVTFRVPSGGIAFVEGRSGTGKSTLFNVIAGLLLPDAGEVWLGETALHQLAESGRDRFRARHIGYIFQSFHLLQPLTVWENIYVPGLLAGVISPGDHRQRARQIAEELGLGEQLEQPPYQLSVGQRQRVAVGRALFQQPDLLLADEPTASLDADSSRIVKEALLRLHHQGTTLLLATHDPLWHDLEADARYDLEKQHNQPKEQEGQKKQEEDQRPDKENEEEQESPPQQKEGGQR
jgi:ABC-type lipoprotein export system ATPase subunit